MLFTRCCDPPNRDPSRGESGAERAARRAARRELRGREQRGTPQFCQPCEKNCCGKLRQDKTLASATPPSIFSVAFTYADPSPARAATSLEHTILIHSTHASSKMRGASCKWDKSLPFYPSNVWLLHHPHVAASSIYNAGESSCRSMVRDPSQSHEPNNDIDRCCTFPPPRCHPRPPTVHLAVHPTPRSSVPQILHHPRGH